jgi:hypothetical protein
MQRLIFFIIMKGILVGSKFLDKKWKKHEHDEHMRRIKDMKSQIAQVKPYRPDPKMRLQKKEAEELSKLH